MYTQQTHKKVYRKPEFKPQLLTDKAIDWLGTRGITPEVAARNQITLATKYFPQVEEERSAIAFPFVRNGEVVNVKYRTHDKYFTQESGAEKCWYKYDDIDSKCTIITEGEFDALAFEVAGYRHAISVPDGAPAIESKSFDKKFTYIDVEDPTIEAVEKFILAVDNDAPGKKLEEELARRLGKERCYRVRWPEGCRIGFISANNTVKVVKMTFSNKTTKRRVDSFKILTSPVNIDPIVSK